MAVPLLQLCGTCYDDYFWLIAPPPTKGMKGYVVLVLGITLGRGLWIECL